MGISMTFKIINTAIVAITLLTSSMVNIAAAGLINADVFGNDANDGRAFTLDNPGYNLKWLDFGSIAGSAYQDLATLTGVGGTYEGWRIANQFEATELWDELFFSKVGGGITSDNGDKNYSRTKTSIITNLLDQYKSITGMTYFIGAPTVSGFYQGEDDTINLVHFHGSYDISNLLNRVSGDLTNYPSNAAPMVQLLLVQGESRTSGAANVPEPSTLAIFALALTGFAARRFKNNKLNY